MIYRLNAPRKRSRNALIRHSGAFGLGSSPGCQFQLEIVLLRNFTDPSHIQKAKAEFDQKRGPNFVYKTRLADRKPALDYRK